MGTELSTTPNVPDFLVCLRLCNENPNAVGVSYNTEVDSDNECILYSQITGVNLDADWISYHCGILDVGRRFQGTLDLTIQKDDVFQCVNHCSLIDGVAMSYDTNNENCEIYSATTGQMPAANFVSGKCGDLDVGRRIQGTLDLTIQKDDVFQCVNHCSLIDGVAMSYDTNNENCEIYSATTGQMPAA